MPFVGTGTGSESGAGTVQELVEAVLEDGQFDATNAQALRWLNTRHRIMCSTARCYRKTITLGTPVAGAYPLPIGVVEILQVTVGGTVYGQALHKDFAEGAQGWIWLSGVGGIAGREDDSSGAEELRLYPALEAGSTAVVQIYAAVAPPLLQIGVDSAIKIPADQVDALVAGAIATGQLRLENRPDLAAPNEQIFAAGLARLKRDTDRRYRGAGPQLARIVGLTA